MILAPARTVPPDDGLALAFTRIGSRVVGRALGVGRVLLGEAVGLGLGDPTTLSAVAHASPAEHVSPFGKAAVASLVPGAASTVTFTRNEIVACVREVLPTPSGGTLQASFLVLTSSVRPRFARV